MLLNHVNSIKQTFVYILMALAINIQLHPLLDHFWNKIFNGGLDGEQEKITLEIGFIYQSAIMTISFLLAIWGSITKIGMITLNFLIALFAVGYTLNYQVVL